ncbi:MAG: fibrobacter succinogenes major paralogous domain-containing protein [Candidatus Symbiothrix sp.]|jgi:hypothetical protein|nr:fibrobacter succinogenes major paralogous domain-containing protein [Candidatus Symbiothrix sp.]
MKRNVWVLAIFFVTFGSGIHAQVIIGGSSTDNPHAGAILDLKSTSLGLLLPRVALIDFDVLTVGGAVGKGSDETATSMTVYNTNAYALDGIGWYVWDGAKWNGINPAGCVICNGDYYDTPTDAKYKTQIPVPSGTLTFLTYNLGANPELSIKEQMAYQSKVSPTYEDITLYGGLYQWGRKDREHSLRCPNDAGHANHFKTDGQYSSLSEATSDGRFVWTSSNLTNSDWINPQKNDLWGNGGGLDTQTATAYTGSENAGNPCPSGFRVPTQHEWSMLIGETLTNASNSANNDFFNFPLLDVSFTNARNPDIVWVRVKNGKTAKSWSTGAYEAYYNNFAENSGYAIYAVTEWNNYTTEENIDLTASAAPNPLMFLPAAGYRFSEHANVGGLVCHTGQYGAYWSSTGDDGSGSIHCPGDGNGFRSWDIGLSSVDVNAYVNTCRTFGMSVRCISE